MHIAVATTVVPGGGMDGQGKVGLLVLEVNIITRFT